MVAARPSPAPLGPVYPAGSALGGGWGLLWPYRSRVVGWCLHAVLGMYPVQENRWEKAALFLLAEMCLALALLLGAVATRQMGRPFIVVLSSA